LLKRIAQLIGVLCLAFLAVSPAQGGPVRVGACGVSAYSYAGLRSDVRAHGVAATLVPVRTPTVYDGHVGGWVGVGGTMGGPGGVAEWIQVGLASFSDSRTSHMYYEVTVAGKSPRYVELDPDVRPGSKHRVAVLETAGRKSWWRVWVDGRPVSPPIHLPGSHGAWYPQAVAENFAGSSGACNAYTYRFADLMLAQASGGNWQPLRVGSVYEDRGYKVARASATPPTFVATNV
jgi:hypothetical protein